MCSGHLACLTLALARLALLERICHSPSQAHRVVLGILASCTDAALCYVCASSLAGPAQVGVVSLCSLDAWARAGGTAEQLDP